jgi:hypothetical protein
MRAIRHADAEQRIGAVVGDRGRGRRYRIAKRVRGVAQRRTERAFVDRIGDMQFRHGECIGRRQDRILGGRQLRDRRIVVAVVVTRAYLERARPVGKRAAELAPGTGDAAHFTGRIHELAAEAVHDLRGVLDRIVHAAAGVADRLQEVLGIARQAAGEGIDKHRHVVLGRILAAERDGTEAAAQAGVDLAAEQEAALARHPGVDLESAFHQKHGGQAIAQVFGALEPEPRTRVDAARQLGDRAGRAAALVDDAHVEHAVDRDVRLRENAVACSSQDGHDAQ